MYQFFIVLLLTGFSLQANAQTKNPLANTAWQGEVYLEQPANVVFTFKTDTVDMRLSDTKEIIETMTYTVKDDVMTWKKTSGGSPCDTQGSGRCRYTITNDALTLTVIQDDCEARASSLPGTPFKKVAFAGK
ncbi:hypothetical protein [Spirosoma pulveris]